jgi:GTP-binding protein
MQGEYTAPRSIHMSLFPAAAFLKSANDERQFVPDEGAEVAFVGRSNAGKSSAINAILNRRNFARISKSPGRTQLVNFFGLDGDEGSNHPATRRLVDLPGYGFARVGRSMRNHWRSLMDDYFRSRESLQGLFLIVDSRRLLSEFDLKMLEWCNTIGCPVHVLLSKADKLKRQEATKALAAVQSELGQSAVVQLFSATKHQGVEQARDRLVALLAEAPGRA